MSIRWKHKEDAGYRHNGILFSQQKEWDDAKGSNLIGSRDYHPKWRESEREKTNTTCHLYMGSKIWYKSTYLQIKNRLTDIENRLVVANEEECEFGINRGKLLYVGWVNNKVLLYSTGNYIQYPVTNHNEKEYEKEYTSIFCCSVCWTDEINTTL